VTGGGPPPTTVDLRPSLTKVRDQGQRSACLAFTVTAAHEVAIAAATAGDLSVEALYWGCKRVDGNWRGGTTFSSASVAISRPGQPTEAAWPYDATQRDGVAYSPPGRVGGRGWYKSSLRQVSSDPNDVRGLLNGGTPVALGLLVFDTLLRPDAHGRIREPSAGAVSRGRHAVLAVGYQRSDLLIRNSWGDSWALGGYAWIADGYIVRHCRDAWVVDGAAGDTAGRGASDDAQGDVYGDS
jgi:C1A family cysteine protease